MIVTLLVGVAAFCHDCCIAPSSSRDAAKQRYLHAAATFHYSSNGDGNGYHDDGDGQQRDARANSSAVEAKYGEDNHDRKRSTT